MKKSSVLLMLCLLIVSAVLHFRDTAYAADTPKFTKHFNESLFNITDKGLFSVEVLLDDKEYGKLGKGLIGLVIHDQHDEDVEGAEIKIIPVMPEGKAGDDAPVVKEKGEGFYTVSGLNLKKESKWELKISVKKKKLEDNASFIFPDVLKTPMHKGKYTP